MLAGNKFVELATRESDNNVKIITLERINQLHKQHPGVLQDLSLEILRVLSSQDLDVKRKLLMLLYNLSPPEMLKMLLSY